MSIKWTDAAVEKPPIGKKILAKWVASSGFGVAETVVCTPYIELDVKPLGGVFVHDYRTIAYWSSLDEDDS